MISQNLSFPLVATSYTSYDHQITVHQDPGDNSHYFWSCQFFLTNHMPGYMGLQTDTSSDGHFLGRGIRVGMADAIKAYHEDSNEVLAGISGKTIFLPYQWHEGTTYTLSVRKVTHENKGNWWQFSVKDHDTQSTHRIGSFFLPFEDGLSHEIVTRTEYLGPGSRNHFPKSGAAEFFNPLMSSFEGNHEEVSSPSSSQFERPVIAGCKIKRGSHRFSSLHQIKSTQPPETAQRPELPLLKAMKIVISHLKLQCVRRVLEF